MSLLTLRIGAGVLTLVGAMVEPGTPPTADAPTNAGGQERAVDARPTPAALRLVHTTEVRHRFEPGVTLENAPYFGSGGPPTGKQLMCDLVIDGLPKTSRVMSVAVLSEEARDDRGSDLIKTIRARVDNDSIMRLNRDIAFETAAPAIRWYLAGPARSASTFDAALHVRATVSARRDDLKIRPTRDWQPLKHPSIDHLNVEYRWHTSGGENTYLEMRPPAVEQYVYFLAPQAHGRRSGRPHFSAADSTSGDFGLERGTPEGAEIHLQLHADITTVEAVLTLDDHPLP